MEYSSRSSKSHKVRYFLPSVRPSYLSLTLLFGCGILWLKNEATNDRLLVLETRLTMLPLNERAVDNLPKATHEGKSHIQTENSAELFEAKRLGPPSGKNHNCCVRLSSRVGWGWGRWGHKTLRKVKI